MATVNILFQKTKAAIGALVLDVSLTESHAAEVEVTEHPVETGANISDHARPKPETLVIEGLVSNTPLPAPGDPTQNVSLKDSRGQVIGQATTSSKQDLSRAGEAYRDLLDLKNSSELLTVVTALRTYTNMKITNLTVPRDARTGQALRFSCTLKEVRLASSRTVTVTLPSQKKAKGPVVPKTTPEATDRASTLHKLKEKAGGLAGLMKASDTGIAKALNLFGGTP